jgi:hypothetical protein
VLGEREKGEKRRERQEMMEILKRFEEGRPEDEVDIVSQLEGAEEEEEEKDDSNSLSSRLAKFDISVTDAPPEVIWEVLTSEERKSFLETIKDPNATAVLSQQAQRDFSFDPWWTDQTEQEERKQTKLPSIVEVPPSLIPQRVDMSHPKPPLIYNIVSIWSVTSFTGVHR